MQKIKTSRRTPKNKLQDEQIIDGILFKRHNEGRFATSKCGKVLGALGRIIKGRSQGSYIIVAYVIEIDNHFIYRNSYIHRLVAETWVIGQSIKYKVVNHKDCNKLNNHADNLEWVSIKENNNHALENGLTWNLPKKGQCGFRRKDGNQKHC